MPQLPLFRAIGAMPATLVLAWASGLATAQTTLVPFVDTEPAWKYLDRGTPPENWNAGDFDDSQWETGAAPLGYGEAGLRTLLNSGDDAGERPISAYFRRQVAIQSPDALAHVVLYLRCDDGAILYINGSEIARHNMPPGDILPNTAALADVQGLHEHIYQRIVLPPSAFVAGTNVLAVQAHQSALDRDDLYLSVVLKGYSKDEPARPRISADADAVVRQFRHQHYVGAGLAIPDGYTDGGRGMVIDADSNVRSGREILVVDRKRDDLLREYLKFAGSEEIRSQPPLERATTIAKYIDQAMSGSIGREAAAGATELLARAHSNEAVLLGEVATLCGSGACRHRSLLFKLMADEAGLDVALVRGNARFGFFSGGHAWNELKLPDGQVLLVDVMNPPPDFQFPSIKDSSVRAYYTVDNKPYYTPAKSGEDE